MGNFKAPNLAVIDRAIWLVEHDIVAFSCAALWQAARKIDKAQESRQDQYSKQYTKFVFQGRGKYNPPFWWNYPQYAGLIGRARACRIRALQGFKQACIDAAKSN